MGPVSLNDQIVLPFVRQAGFAARHPWSYGERKLLDYLLIYVEKGLCRFVINGQTYLTQEGDYYLIQPGDLVSLEGLTETVTPFMHLDFFYNPQREQSFPTSVGMIHLDSYSHLMQPRLNDIPGVSVPHRFHPAQSVLFKNKLYRMIGRWQEGTALALIEVQQLGTELFLELMRDFGSMKDTRETDSAHLDRVLAHINLHLHETITVKQMADQVHLSPSRFTVVFKERYGVSPFQYLMRLRVERAMELLRAKTYSITQIAEYCGFNNIQHFSRTFREITGQTPSAYRKQFASVKEAGQH